MNYYMDMHHLKEKMIYIKSIVKKVLRILNLELRTLVAIKFPPELSIQEIQAITYVKNNHLTMGSILKLIDTAMAVKYIIKNNISGDFVECGVWRGGHSILAKKIFELNQDGKLANKNKLGCDSHGHRISYAI